VLPLSLARHSFLRGKQNPTLGPSFIISFVLVMIASAFAGLGGRRAGASNVVLSSVICA
jgi:hypothetical protein